MATTKIPKALEDVNTTEIPRLSMVDDSDLDWLTEELKSDLKEGLDIVTKIDSGEEFTEWNNWIVQVVGLVPGLKDHLTVRKTKKGVKYYGVDKKIYTALKDVTGVDGLPAL